MPAPLVSVPSTLSTHLRSALFSRVRTVHDAFSPLSTALGGDRCDHGRFHQAASLQMAAAALIQLAALPFACCWLWQCTVALFAPGCMIPRHDLGSSPRHAACPVGLDGRRLCAGATLLPAMSSAAPLRLHATGCRAVCCASVLIPSPHADSRSCVSICPCDLGTGAAFVRSENQEWPVAGFSLLAVLCRCLCVCPS